jgi:hypothetical protein
MNTRVGEVSILGQRLSTTAAAGQFDFDPPP